MLRQPQCYYNNLPYKRVDDCPFNGTPKLCDIRMATGDGAVKALLIIAINEVVQFINVSKNMNVEQVTLTAELVYDKYFYLTLPEIKHVFRGAMAHNQLYDRLDGNIILGWLAEYDVRRTNNVIDRNDNEDKFVASRTAPIGESDMTLKEYRSRLKQLAEKGDAIALAKLKEQDELISLGFFPKYLLEEDEDNKHQEEC